MVSMPTINPRLSPLTQDAQYRLLVEAITDYAIYMLDPTGAVISWNAGAQKFKGFAASEIVGKNFAMFYTAEDRARGEPERALETAARDGRFESEGWRIRKDGSRFWASVVVDPIRAADGALIGFAKITRDVTRQREAQSALDQAQAAVVQTQKLDAIGQLTASAAHDFNNLLDAILTSLDPRPPVCAGRSRERPPDRQRDPGGAAGRSADAAHARLFPASRAQVGVDQPSDAGSRTCSTSAVVPGLVDYDRDLPALHLEHRPQRPEPARTGAHQSRPERP